MDYGFFNRQVIAHGGVWSAIPPVDLLLSAYNLSDRVRDVFDNFPAGEKLWLIHSEYNIDEDKYPPEAKFETTAKDESSYCVELYEHVEQELGGFAGKSVAIDSTGMLRPHLLFFIKLLHRKGISKFHILYAEPAAYKRREDTTFSAGAIYEVRPVQGFEGAPATNSMTDFLVIGMGYDDRMIAEVAEDRAKADKHQLFGLPSLSADMYQQSVLRSRRASEELSDPNFSENNRSFAPASDPFGTAAALSDIIASKRRRQTISNLYLSPVGTKPQVIGFALYHIYECTGGEGSIIFPFSYGYSPETGQGISKVWSYQIEF